MFLLMVITSLKLDRIIISIPTGVEVENSTQAYKRSLFIAFFDRNIIGKKEGRPFLPSLWNAERGRGPWSSRSV